MSKEPLYGKVSKYVKYDNMSNWNPIKPFTIWANTNALLDDFYKRPEININDDERGLNIKNSMRHIVGPALMTQAYNSNFTRYMGGLKEAKDFYSGQPFNDQIIDLRNNQRGINYAKNNPNFTKENLLRYALTETLKNYNQDYNSPTLKELLFGGYLSD